MSSWKGLALATIVAAAGCVAYTPVQPLDDAEQAELARLAPLLRAERLQVVPRDDRSRRAAEELTSALGAAGASPVGDAPSLTIEALPDRPPFAEPMLGVLTLGFFPEFSRRRHAFGWRLLGDDGREGEGGAVLESPCWVGWLVPPIALLPRWRLSATWEKDEMRDEEKSGARRARLALEIARSVARLRGAD